MEADNNLLLKAIQNLLCHVKIGDHEDIVLPFCFELTWEYLQKKIQSKRLHLTSSVVADIIIKWLEKHEYLTKEYCLSFLGYLQLLMVARYNYRISEWQAFKLRGQIEECETDVEIFQNNINYLFQNTNYEGFVTIDENRIWLQIKKKNTPNQRGLFFSYTIGTKYVFGSKSTFPVELRQKLCSLLSFNDLEPRPLSGKNLNELYKLIEMKKQRKLDIDQQLEYKEPTEFPCIEQIRDFTQKQSRHEFAEALFGEVPPAINKIKVKKNGITMEIKAKNVLESIKECIVEEVFPVDAAWLMDVATTLDTEYCFEDD